MLHQWAYRCSISGKGPLEAWIPPRNVGDVDLPESKEPLLKESQRRFVLFPIQNREVCCP